MGWRRLIMRHGLPTPQLPFESYQPVDAESFYYMWDVVTTCGLADQSLFQPPTTMSLGIEAPSTTRKAASNRSTAAAKCR